MNSCEIPTYGPILPRWAAWSLWRNRRPWTKRSGWAQHKNRLEFRLANRRAGESSRVHLQAPVGVMTLCIRGKVKLRIPATIHFVSKIFVDWRSVMLTESVVDANSPGHSLLALNGREHLGRVLESDWSFTQRVGDSEKVDESSRRNVISQTEHCKHPWRTYKTTGPIFSPRLPVVFSRDRPAANRKIHMNGKVLKEPMISHLHAKSSERLTIRVRVRRPLVSMRNSVGIVNTTCIAP